MPRIRPLLSCLLIFCATATAQAQMKWNQLYQTYIDQYKDLAIEEMLKYHIPASITLAQGLFESGAGRSVLSTQGNNHFGIKCHGWTGPSMSKDDDAVGECFRVYGNARESFEDHSKFLAKNARYARLFLLDQTDYRGWANGLKACGYATNPHYAKRLIDLIELYKLNQYDKARNYDKFMAERSGNDRPADADAGLHPIHTFNKNYYIVAREGDTFKAIGLETGLSYRKLARYNERNRKDVLHAGEIVFLKKKRRSAPKDYKKRPHVVKAGESMYMISQYYGIRLKSLYKKNHLKPDYQIKVGDVLRVY